jgi:hypothetical protein
LVDLAVELEVAADVGLAVLTGYLTDRSVEVRSLLVEPQLPCCPDLVETRSRCRDCRLDILHELAPRPLDPLEDCPGVRNEVGIRRLAEFCNTADFPRRCVLELAKDTLVLVESLLHRFNERAFALQLPLLSQLVCQTGLVEQSLSFPEDRELREPIRD